MKIRSLLILISLLAGIAASAQGRIDRVIDDLEKKNDVETTYTERRTPKTHKLYRVTVVMGFNNDKYFERLAKAFEDEREKAVSAVKSREYRTYRFIDDKGTSTYTLYKNSVVKTWRSVEDNSDDESCVESSWNFNPIDRVLVSANFEDPETMARRVRKWHREIEEAARRASEEAQRYSSASDRM